MDALKLWEFSRSQDRRKLYRPRFNFSTPLIAHVLCYGNFFTKETKTNVTRNSNRGVLDAMRVFFVYNLELFTIFITFASYHQLKKTAYLCYLNMMIITKFTALPKQI